MRRARCPQVDVKNKSQYFVEFSSLQNQTLSSELGGAALWPVLPALRDQLRVQRPVGVVEMDPRRALRLLVVERRPLNGLRKPCD